MVWGLDLGEKASQHLGRAEKSKPRFQGSRTLLLLQAGVGFLGRPFGLIKDWLATCSVASGSPHSRPAPSTWVLLMATSEVPRAWLDRMSLSPEGGQRFINRPLFKPTQEKLSLALRARQVYFALTEQFGQTVVNVLNSALAKT